MASAINPNGISGTDPTAQSVRDNFQHAHDEIGALQAASGTGAGALLAPGPPGPLGPHPYGTVWVNETPAAGAPRVAVWMGGPASTETSNWATWITF